MTNQLIKNTSLGTLRVYPKTYTEGITDKSTGKKLAEILSSFNMYFLSYTGNTAQTRCQVPKDLRREGLWITYVDFNHKVITEWYNSDNIEDDTFGSDTYWRQGSNKLIGDISISSNGNWVINGKETEFKATGDPIKPLLRVNFSTNKLQVSYDNGNKYDNLGDNPVYTLFRTLDNKLQVSTDLGKTWTDTSEYIAAWFRWTDADSNSNLGKILISRDNTTWLDMTPNFVNNLYIKGYVATVGELPTNTAALGDIYMVGPTYDESDITHDYPHYRMWVKLSSGWVDNGEYLSNILISLITGLETGITMSLKAITDALVTEKNRAEAAEQDNAQGIIYDVSSHNGGAVFESLQALLSSSNLSTLVPTSVRHGGMSIRFVQSSDNKYVQYRLMSTAWSNNEYDWQGVDREPVAGSRNLVESGEVKEIFTDIIGQDSNFLNNCLVQANGNIANYNGICVSTIIPVNVGDLLEWFIGSFNNDNFPRRLCFYNSLEVIDSTTYVEYYAAYVGTARTLIVPTDAVCVRFTFDAENIDKTWLSVNGKKVYVPLISKTGIINEKISELSNEVNTRISVEETKREELSIVYDSTVNDVLEKQLGTIYTSGELTSTSKYYRWFVKNSSFSKIEICSRTTPNFAQVAFYNSETPSVDTLIKSYAGISSKKTYSLDIPKDCVLIGFSCLIEVFEEYFYYKIYTKNLVYTSNLQSQITTNRNDLQSQITGLGAAYDKDSFKRESGTILADGNSSTSNNYVRWFIKNNNYKHITTYARAAGSMLCLAFYNSEIVGDGSLITGYPGTYSKEVYDYDIPKNCVFIGVSTQISSLTEEPPFYLKIYLNELTPITNQINTVEDDIRYKIGESTDIVALNNPLDTARRLHHLNRGLLTLLHFSDLHHDILNLRRIVQYRDTYADYITDSICTGDLVWNLYTDPLDWDSVEGSENILRTIGNHETALDNNSWSGAAADDVYDKFLAGAIDNWSVVHEGKNHYYYKDYAQGIRLVVLDPYYDLENQNTWLQGVLANAKENKLSIICAEHNPFSSMSFVECSFTELRLMIGSLEISSHWGNMIQPFVASVDSFQNDGGDFICWISGHTHCDIVSTHAKYPRQLMLTASAATHVQDSDNMDYRIEGTKSQDNFNLYAFDVAQKIITIYRVGQDIDGYMRHKGSMCISYDTKKVFWND